MSNNKAQLLKLSLMDFYKSKENIYKFVNVIEKNTEYSLRIIEWFCNNYSKKYDISYKLGNNKIFNVYLSYKTQLDSYQKKQFDPFKRKHNGFEKFSLKYDDNKTIITTVGQLNFFKWCICNNVFDYIQSHLREIKLDMNNSINYSKLSNKSNNNITNNNTTITLSRKKRQPLSVSATRLCIKRYTKVHLDFK